MSNDQAVRVDERTAAIMDAGSRWALNFMTIALLIDIICRAAIRNEFPIDLFALVGISSAISIVYAVRQKAFGLRHVFGNQVLLLGVLVAMVVAFITAIILTAT